MSASDEPGLEMEFWGQGFGLTQPPGCSIKGSHDPYRSPTTQTAWGGHHYLSVYKMGNFPFYPFWTADHFVDGGQVDCEIDEADLLKAGGA